jgi:hypothetical protein
MSAGTSSISRLAEGEGSPRRLLPSGIYQLVDISTGSALDLSGADNATLIGWPPHDGKNQLVRSFFARVCLTNMSADPMLCSGTLRLAMKLERKTSILSGALRRSCI